MNASTCARRSRVSRIYNSIISTPTRAHESHTHTHTNTGILCSRLAPQSISLDSIRHRAAHSMQTVVFNVLFRRTIALTKYVYEFASVLHVFVVRRTLIVKSLSHAESTRHRLSELIVHFYWVLGPKRDACAHVCVVCKTKPNAPIDKHVTGLEARARILGSCKSNGACVSSRTYANE